MFQNFPYTDMHQLNLDWIIAEIKKFKEDYGNIDSFIQDAIDKYIEEHPDYLIEDDSITSLKLNKSNIPFYNVTDYNVLPDTGDIYRELHSLIKDKVSQTGGILYFPKGVYTISYTVFIPANTTVIGDGDLTEIYFNEEDTTFGTALCNAGSDVKICNIKISQRSKGPFGTGAAPGCIGFSNISLTQCQEPAYSHNFNRESLIKNLSAENIVFDGQYPIQTESGATGTIDNVVYKNLISNGCVSVYCPNNSILNNVQIDNVICDLLRFVSAGTARNIKINNVITNSIYYNSNTEVVLSNIYGKGNIKNNSFSGLADFLITGDIVIKDSYFTGTDQSAAMFYVYTGIRKWDNVKCVAKTNQRILQRLSPLADNDNYEIMYNCNWTCDQAATTTLLIGYGKNNNMTGSINKALWGDMIYQFSIPNGASSSFLNCFTANNETLSLSLFFVPVTSAMPAIFTLPSWFDLPIYTNNGSIEILLFNSQSGATTVTWGKIEDRQIKITDAAHSSTLGSYDRAVIKQDLKLTRPLTPTEIYHNFIG